MRNDFKIEAISLGTTEKSMCNLKNHKPGPDIYRGSFTDNVKRIINKITYGRILNLYSGSSTIGMTRVDIDNKNATHNCTVEEFISRDLDKWDWVILDPPYKIIRQDFLKNYADARPLSGNTLLQDRLRLYFRKHANNVLWIDYCIPRLPGFKWEHMWILIPNRLENIRALVWHKRENFELDLPYQKAKNESQNV